MPQIEVTEEQRALLMSLLGVNASQLGTPVDKSNPLMKIKDLTKRKLTEHEQILNSGSHMERHHQGEALKHMIKTVHTMYDEMTILKKANPKLFPTDTVTIDMAKTSPAKPASLPETDKPADDTRPEFLQKKRLRG
jgi:hypothetical protein